MKLICMHCGAEKIINGTPGTGNISHGSCLKCYIRIDLKQIKELGGDPQPDKISSNDKADMKDDIRELRAANAEWIGTDGKPVLDSDPELKQIYESLTAEVIAEAGDTLSRK